MAGIWGASGFDPATDIPAITVNRWPHGYARDHLNLEDPAWNANPPPNVTGRQTFGNIAIANSDAGADAYTLKRYSAKNLQVVNDAFRLQLQRLTPRGLRNS
jgi:hypothetical protein